MKIKVFLKNYKYELIALGVDVLLGAVAFLKFTQFFAFIVTLVVFVVSTFIIIYFRTKDRTFYYCPFDSPGEEQNWVGRGNLNFVRELGCFEITNSDVGFIFPKTLNWDDYRYELDFKITKTCLGVIIRAVNLSNSVMYQIYEDRIRPHLRVNGQWIWMDEIELARKLSLDNWYRLEVICNKRNVNIRILDVKENNELVCDRSVSIPLNMRVNIPMDVEERKVKTEYIQNIDFDFGAIGLRNFGDERSLVKNLFVERL